MFVNRVTGTFLWGPRYRGALRQGSLSRAEARPAPEAPWFSRAGRRQILKLWTMIIEREESMTLSAHKVLFSLITLAALLGFGWVLIVYVVSFRAAQWVVDRIEDGMTPRRPALRPVRVVRVPRRASYSRA